MLKSNDPLHPQAFLDPGETLLWSGRPDPSAHSSGIVKIIKAVGVIDLICFAIFAAIAWANRAEMDGVGVFVAVLLGLCLFGGVFMIWGIPKLIGRGQAQTRYGITEDRVMLVHGMNGPRVSMIRVRPDADIRIIQTTKGLANVVYGQELDMIHTPHVPTPDPQGRSPVVRRMQFDALPVPQAELAAAALEEIKGKGGEGPINEDRPV